LPRKARQISESGIYHIIMRGINKQLIFNEDEDSYRFLQTLKYYKDPSGYQLFAYCLMGNHIHLLLKVGAEPLQQVMRRICGKYVYWYNQKYERTGYLFQDRFKSEPVEDDRYFVTVLRYIHQNPLKARIVDEISKYRWSSFNDYLRWDGNGLVDTDFALSIFNSNKEKALPAFVAFNNQVTDDQCLEFEDKKKITDKVAIEIFEQVLGIYNNGKEFQDLDKGERNQILNRLKDKEGLSIRQIEKITGINRGVVLKA